MDNGVALLMLGLAVVALLGWLVALRQSLVAQEYWTRARTAEKILHQMGTVDYVATLASASALAARTEIPEAFRRAFQGGPLWERKQAGGRDDPLPRNEP